MNNSTIAIVKNNDGIQYMGSGNYASAVLSFRHSLATIKKLAASVELQPPTSQQQSWELDVFPCLSRVDDSNACAIFTKCFALVPPQDMNDLPSESATEVFSATVLYNIGLATHLEGLTRSRQRVNYCRKALRVYQIAADMLRGLDATPETTALLLAASNNAASLALEMNDFDTFETHRECMGTILCEDDGFHADFFLTNYSATRSLRDNPAAAA